MSLLQIVGEKLPPSQRSSLEMYRKVSDKPLRVPQSVEKYGVIDRVKGSWEVQERQNRNITRVKSKKDIVSKSCFNAMIGAIGYIAPISYKYSYEPFGWVSHLRIWADFR